MMVATLSIAPMLLSSYAAGEQSASAVYATTWTSNLFFALSTVDYFAELRTQDIFLHTWSLGVEEQFYLVWPLVLLITISLLAKQMEGTVRHSRLLRVLILLFAISLLLSWYWTAKEPLWSFYLMPSRIWQFALGAAVFAWFHGRDRAIDDIPRMHKARWSIVAGFIGLALIIGSALVLRPDMVYPGFWALLPSLGTALVITAGHQHPTLGASRLLGHPILVWIGDRSYSWYLWHWPVLMLGFAWGLQHYINGTLGLIALSLLLAMLSYRLIELPFWKGDWSRAAPRSTILLSILAMLIVVGGVLNYFHRPQSTSSKALPNVSIANAARADLPMIYAAGCDAWYANANVKPCIIGKQEAPKTAVLLGDSVGAQWFSLLPEIFKAPEWRIVVLTKSSCAMVDEDYIYPRINQVYTVCTKWRNAVLEYLAGMKPDVVFVGTAATYHFSEKEWIDGSTRVIDQLAKAAGHVIVVPGTPHLSFDGPSCLARQTLTLSKIVSDGATVCREPLESNQTSVVANYLKRAIHQIPNAKLLDLNDLVCPADYCAAQDPTGLVVFRDSQHLTNSFVRSQVPNVIERLTILGLLTNM